MPDINGQNGDSHCSCPKGPMRFHKTNLRVANDSHCGASSSFSSQSDNAYKRPRSLSVLKYGETRRSRRHMNCMSWIWGFKLMRVAIKLAILIASLLLTSKIASAQNYDEIVGYQPHRSPLGHIAYYVKTHKQFLAMDALTATSISLDVIASNRCQRIGHELSLEDGMPNQCVEQDSILGQHPSSSHTWGIGIVWISTFVTLNHLGHWSAPTTERGHSLFPLCWSWNVMVSAAEIDNIRDAWNQGSDLAAARARLLRGQHE